MGNLRMTILAARAGVPRAQISRRLAAGDPFWGALLGGAAKLAGKFIPKATAWLGRAAQRTVGGIARKAATPVGQAVIGGTAAGLVGPGLGLMGRGVTALRGGASTQKLTPAERKARGLPAYTRIDPTNARALRRALSRTSMFIRMYKKSASHLGFAVVRRGTARVGKRKRVC